MASDDVTAAQTRAQRQANRTTEAEVEALLLLTEAIKALVKEVRALREEA